MTHYVIILEWTTSGGDHNSTILGITHSMEAAEKIFQPRMKEERQYIKEYNMTIYDDTPTCFDAANDYGDSTCIYIQEVEVNDEKETNEMNEILERLRNGETEESIAAEFTAKLNEAAATLKAEDTKGEDTEALLNHINDYFAKYYPSVPTELCVKDFLETLDALVGTCETLLKTDPKDLNFGDIWKLFA